MPQAIPLDIAMMRESSARILDPEAALPRHEDLQHREQLLRGHLGVIVPEVEALARLLPDGHTAQASALVAVGHARTRLAADPGAGLVSATGHAKSLARALRTLCDQYEALDTRVRQEQPS